jgi:hypothetical protein
MIVIAEHQDGISITDMDHLVPLRLTDEEAKELLQYLRVRYEER